MTVKEFVEGYDNIASDKLKMAYINDNLEVKNHITITDKINFAESVVNATSYEIGLDGKRTGLIKINSISRHIFFILKFIDEYTNIDVDIMNALNEYELLSNCGLLHVLINSESAEDSILPIGEYLDVQSLMNMALDDLIKNEMSTQAFIGNQVERFGILIGTNIVPMMEKINDTIENLDSNNVDAIIKNLGKAFKKIK